MGQLHSNVAICAMMLGQLAESLRHTEESLEALKAISDTDSTRQKLIDKNNLRKTTLSRLSASIVKTRACASGSLVNSLPHGRASQVSSLPSKPSPELLMYAACHGRRCHHQILLPRQIQCLQTPHPNQIRFDCKEIAKRKP